MPRLRAINSDSTRTSTPWSRPDRRLRGRFGATEGSDSPEPWRREAPDEWGAEAATVVIIVRPGCAEVRWLARSGARSDIECPPSGTAGPVAERYPLESAGSDRVRRFRAAVDMECLSLGGHPIARNATISHLPPIPARAPQRSFLFSGSLVRSLCNCSSAMRSSRPVPPTRSAFTVTNAQATRRRMAPSGAHTMGCPMAGTTSRPRPTTSSGATGSVSGRVDESSLGEKQLELDHSLVSD